MSSNFSRNCSLKDAKVKDLLVTYYPSVNYLEPEDIILREDSRNHFMNHGGNYPELAANQFISLTYSKVMNVGLSTY